MTVVCPCCGHEFAGNLYAGCTACGARAVGEPLSRPLRELPSYIPAFFACVTGALLLAILIVSTITAQLEHGSLFHTSFSALADAAETAAWRIKYAALPASIAALWIALRTQARVRRFPLRFAGTRLAHAGIAGSALALLLIAASIGVTVPERLRRRQLGITAASNAQLWTINRALLKYRAQSGTFPMDLHDLQQLPDNDGSIAAALAAVDPNGNGYKPTSVQARLPKRVRSLRGAALRTISATNVNDLPDEGLTFTNYELTLPGADKILGTADDVTMRDSVIIEPSKPSRSSAATLSSSDASAP
ncbi:MAG: hypothetical protein ACR2LC_05305 [Pyrinomonadaceae bacterium]